MGRAHALRVLALGVVLGTALGACSQGQESTSPPAPSLAPPRLAADVVQYRRDVARRVLQVTLTSLEPVTVEQLTLSATGFSPLPATPKDSVLRPGARTDLTVPYGESRCAAPLEGSAAEPSADTATARVRTADGRVHDVRLSLAAGGDVLERIRSRDCEQKVLRSAVRLSLDGWEAATQDGEALLWADLTVRRGDSPQAIVVEGFAGNVLFTLRRRGSATGPLLQVPGDRTQAVLPVEVRASRCDAHALAESKQSYTFRFTVRVGDGQAQVATVDAAEPDRRLLDELVQTTCLAGR